MKAKLFGAAAVLSVALLSLSACSGGGSGGGGYGYGPPATTTAPSTAMTTAPAPGGTVAGLKTAQTRLGTIVVSDTGMTVYVYTNDVRNSGKSNCTGGCLTAWPPVLTTKDAPTLDGVTGTVGTITTPTGAKQVTLDGLPLYYWAQDAAPGDVTGQGVQGVWYVVAPDGSMIK